MSEGKTLELTEKETAELRKVLRFAVRCAQATVNQLQDCSHKRAGEAKELLALAREWAGRMEE